MIITRTPLRISFVGGGSDLEAFYKQSSGAVLSATINKFVYFFSHYSFDEEKLRGKYSRTETVTNLNELKHPVFREVFKKFKINNAFEIGSTMDVPSGTGLGSSSSFIVGLLHNMYAVNGKVVTKAQLAEEACDIEINELKEPIGKQDHYAASFGGLNIIRFNSSGDVIVEPLHLRKNIYKILQNNLLIFYTGIQRETASILLEQRANMRFKNKFETLKEMVGLVDTLYDELHSGNLNEFGNLLHKNWLLKQKLASKISNPMINDLYEKALKNGAVGGKLLGAGGGGFLLLYCDENKQKKLKEAMYPQKELKFELENEGSKLIYIDDEYGKR